MESVQNKWKLRVVAGFHARYWVYAKSDRARAIRESPLQLARYLHAVGTVFAAVRLEKNLTPRKVDVIYKL